MSMLMAFLLLWGLSMSPAAEAATFVETRPDLWAEAESLLKPWANVTLTCQARLFALRFQLFKDGEIQELVELAVPTKEYRFPLGAVTADTQGLYRCSYDMGSTWTQLSNTLEVTGAETLPPPQLSSEPVSWVTPGLSTTLLCRSGLRGVTFLLRREGDDQFLEVAEAPQEVTATFPVHQAGNYSCSYRTHAAGTPSAPSATVTIENMPTPPRPRLSVNRESAQVLGPGSKTSLECQAPLEGVEFQLRHGDKVLLVNMWSSYPDRIFFKLNPTTPEDSGLYTCRYHLRGENMPWSQDSAPVELLLNDETLPAPELSAEPETLRPKSGALVQLRCRGPRAGLRFALVREDRGSNRVIGLQSPADAEARFELRDVSPLDAANYSCLYVDTKPPFAGSLPSASLELHVDGSLPKPQLRALWKGPVSPGRDAALHCASPVSRMPHVTFDLLREGVTVASTHSPSGDLVLTFIGPQHRGNYSCRYSSRPFVSDLSDPVELQVAGY